MSAVPGFPKLLGISGSLRRESYCTAVLRTLQELTASRADLTLFPLNDVPLYNQDIDSDAAPMAVRNLRNSILGSDGLVIVSPEYNYGTSGVLKNAIDWASRPAFKSSLKDKYVLIITASPSFTGGARAQLQLLSAFTGTLSRVITRPQIVIAGVHQKVQEGRLVDEMSLKVSLEGIDDLIHTIQTK